MTSTDDDLIKSAKATISVNEQLARSSRAGEVMRLTINTLDTIKKVADLAGEGVGAELIEYREQCKERLSQEKTT